LAQTLDHSRSFGLVAALTASETVASAAQQAVERIAETFDAEMVAIVQPDCLLASIGYPAGAVPISDLRSLAIGDRDEIFVPGCGICPASWVLLEHPPGAALVLARSGAEGLSRSEVSLLNSLARVLSLRMSMLQLVEQERALREESDRQAAEVAHLADVLAERQSTLEALASEQAALRRVATLVATAVPQEQLFAALAEEISTLSSADCVLLARYEAHDRVVVEAAWRRGAGDCGVTGSRFNLGGQNLATTIRESLGPARIDDPKLLSGEIRGIWGKLGIRVGVATPVVVAGRLWGIIAAGTEAMKPMPPDAEERLARFTELVATAISNAEVRAALAASRARLVTAGDDMRRRIERNLHDGAQQRLVTLALRIRNVREAVADGSAELRQQLGGIETGMAELLEELREISRGLHPAVLSETGLAPALRSLARRSTVPVRLEVSSLHRLPEPLEVAGYYVVSEALANASKHAQATEIEISARVADEILQILICDDGVGGADPVRGSGLIGLRDRVEALGGTLVVLSPHGEGTTIEVRLPTDSGASR
jgi:signal transduction histidine kinase